MARIRSIKPEFWSSLTIAKLSVHARLTFIGLWNYCDDHGRGKDDVRLIKAAVWPLDAYATVKRIEGWMEEIEKVGLILRYPTGETRSLQVASWSEHQRVEKPRRSLIPPPLIPDTSPMLPRCLHDESPGDRKGRERERKGAEGNARENGGGEYRPDDDERDLNSETCKALAEITENELDRSSSLRIGELIAQTRDLRAREKGLDDAALSVLVRGFGVFCVKNRGWREAPSLRQVRDDWPRFRANGKPRGPAQVGARMNGIDWKPAMAQDLAEIAELEPKLADPVREFLRELPSLTQEQAVAKWRTIQKSQKPLGSNDVNI